MSVQRHPSDSFHEKLNYWEEFPSSKIHPILGTFFDLNKSKKTLEASSKLMWVLALCYDRVSSLYTQPIEDKWEASSERLFGVSDFMAKLNSGDTQGKLHFPERITLTIIIEAFIGSIEVPLGISLRKLEDKFKERADFIMDTPYSLDHYSTNDSGKTVLVKGTADSLDKMFANTNKIASQITILMDTLSNADGGEAKGGEKESLGDGDEGF